MPAWPPTDLFDLADPGGKHSNSKMAVFVAVFGTFVSWLLLKLLGKQLTWQDVALLVSLVTATASIRALIALWKGKFNGNGDRSPTLPPG